MKFLYTLSIIAALALLGGGCNIINPSEPVPTYVRVDSFSFNGNVLLGTSSHKITGVYAYLNGQTIGAFDLPAQFPVLFDKKSKLQLTPIIDYNGLGGAPSVYPFYSSYIDSISPAPGTVLNVAPSTGYIASTKVALNVQFENGNPFQAVSSADTPIVLTTNPAMTFEGNHSGLLYLRAGRDSSVNVSSDQFDVPFNTDAYLELNYKSTIPFTIGMVTAKDGNVYNSYIAGFYAKDSWNKIYIDIKGFVSSHKTSTGTNKFQILLRAVKDSEEQKEKDGYVIFDNVKVVTF